MNMKKVCLISSSGGHYEQLICLKSLGNKYDLFFVTEKTKYNRADPNIKHYVHQVNRKQILFPLIMILNFIKSLYILIKEKPDVVISTGVLACIPMLWLAHKFGKKVIYIESFAKITSPTKTGKYIYKHNIADQFYVQWENMKEFYPNAIYKGGIY